MQLTKQARFFLALLLISLGNIISLLGTNDGLWAQSPKKQSQQLKPRKVMYDTATFANGCFWCTEAIFEELNGVKEAISGYTGGQIKNPTYKEVCTGRTGHAECLQIIFDPTVISFEELLEVFWKTHDPTTLNRQGADVGTQYRSGIFYHNEMQREKAQKYKDALNKSGAFDDPIVTEITPFKEFFPAEDYHQQYFELNGDKNPYCSVVIKPKVEKFRKVFAAKLKK